MEASEGTVPAANKDLACAASWAFRYDLPAFFVSPEFLADIAHTDLPEDIKWTETELPYEAGLLYLPPGAMRDPEGASVNVLVWWRARKGDQILVGSKKRIVCEEDQFTVIAICESESAHLYSRVISRTETEYIPPPTVNFNYVTDSPYDLPMTQSDKEFLSQMTALCFSLLLVQATNPELVTPGRRNGKQSKKRKREF